MTALSKTATDLLQEVISLDGIEARVEWFDTDGPFKELKDAERINIGPRRGLDNAWVRITEKEDA